MSEIKRVQLIPLGAQKEVCKSVKEPRKTVRISVVLPESTEDTCPEYNYKDELAAVQRPDRNKEAVPTNGILSLTDFGDDEDEVRKIARQMEEKYGTGIPPNKRKRKGRKDDYADIGMGYDETDSFIDNTDGYDEMIPQNVTTLHGGFYINSGALEFKADEEAESDFSGSSSEDDSSRKAFSRKRVIESSDETDRETKTETGPTEKGEKKRKLQNGGNGLQQSLKKKLMAQNKVYIKKRRLLDPLKKTVKELLREKREDLNMSIPAELDTTASELDPSNKKNMSISNVTDVIESVVKASVEVSKPMAVDKINSPPPADSSHDHLACPTTRPEVKLPENLSAEILSVIAAVRKNCTDANVEAKSNSNSEINLLILRLERKCKCLGKPSKMKVYEHLAAFMNCKTETLIRRAKILVLDDEQKKLKNLLMGLRSEISKVMPALLENYEKESQRVLQKRFSQEGVDNEDSKTLRMPKRRFQWNDTTKKLLKDILMLKKRCLLLEGKSKDVLDTQMTTFLKSDIQLLWPEGWMSMNALNKIYTTYADPKRLLANGSSLANSHLKPPPTPNLLPEVVKSVPPTFSNSNLSITPIVSNPSSEHVKIHSVSNSGDVSLTKTKESSMSLSMKPAADTTPPCDVPAVKKELECKLKVKPQSELLKPSLNHIKKDDGVIVLDPKTERISPKPVKSEDNYCQVIDLSDKNDFKAKNHAKLMPDIISKHHELSITPSYPKTKPSCAGDDIQKVMENLKVLQKMSSPKKCVETSPTSSAVSVIAVNKSFAAKPIANETSTMQRYDYKTSDLTSGFQDEFQKQLFSALNHMGSAAPNMGYNSIDRFPHISSGGTNVAASDKYYQNSNNNYTQNSNGHKNNTPAPQTGTYSILDDMFANLLTQYGYSKEAAASKSQQK